jgi:Ca-activated chloride channel family protein
MAWSNAAACRKGMVMSFDRPVLLVALLLVPAVAGLVILVRRRRARFAVSYTNVDVLAAVARSSGSWRFRAHAALLALTLAALLVAVAGPHVSRMLPTERATVVLALDVSRSMQSQDVKPSRLAAAKRAARAFLDRVPGELRVGLVTFSGDVFVAALPTTDRDRLRAAIAGAGAGNSFGGTAIGDALARAVEVGRDAVAERALASAGAALAATVDTAGVVSIVFLSDGRQNRGILPPLAGAAQARSAGMRVYTVALGTTGAAPDAAAPSWMTRRRAPDPATLRAISRATGGEFFEAESAEAASAAYEELGSRLGRSPHRSDTTVAFVAAAAVGLLAAGLLGALWAPRLP